MELFREALRAMDFSKCLQLIREKSLDLNDQDSRNFHIVLTSPENVGTQLHGGLNSVCTAVMYNWVELIPLLRGHDADLNGQQADGNRPLHFAVLNNNTQMVSMLLEQGVDVNSRGKNDATALHMAILNQKPALGRLLMILLEAGAKTDLTDVKGMQVIHFAALGGDTSTIYELIKFGADANAQIDSMTPLYIACRLGNNVMAEHLLKCGANPEIPGMN